VWLEDRELVYEVVAANTWWRLIVALNDTYCEGMHDLQELEMLANLTRPRVLGGIEASDPTHRVPLFQTPYTNVCTKRTIIRLRITHCWVLSPELSTDLFIHFKSNFGV
jgi:hypothetical protein